MAYASSPPTYGDVSEWTKRGREFGLVATSMRGHPISLDTDTQLRRGVEFVVTTVQTIEQHRKYDTISRKTLGILIIVQGKYIAERFGNLLMEEAGSRKIVGSNKNVAHYLHFEPFTAATVGAKKIVKRSNQCADHKFFVSAHLSLCFVVLCSFFFLSGVRGH